MRKSLLLVATLALTLISACATLRGIAEDAQNLGRGLKKTLGQNEKSSDSST
jgi:predicted small secreted protein